MSSEQQQPSSGGAQQEGQQQETVTITVSSNLPPQQQQQQQGEAPISSRFLSAVNKAKAGMLERPIRYDIISIIFLLLILGGGIYGYVAKESTASLVSGVLFAILLAFGTYFEGAHKNPYPLIITLIGLGGMFVYRYYQNFKFMPSGLLAILTLIMLARHTYLVYTKRQQAAAAAPSAGSTQEPPSEP